ncbi:hypothetical protein FACS1894137_03700 [Spirochaetia bacterium]|nr:hypothetical protein FACS1894137_03700 [Spirochaetia bacterium]
MKNYSQDELNKLVNELAHEINWRIHSAQEIDTIIDTQILEHDFSEADALRFKDTVIESVCEFNGRTREEYSSFLNKCEDVKEVKQCQN